MITQHLHNQTPVATLTEDDYKSAEAIICDRLTTAIRRVRDPQPDLDDARAESSQALFEAFPASGAQTVLDWIKRASATLGVDPNAIGGL